METNFNLETLEGRKAAWAWLQDKFGNPLVVTKDGVPFEDQAEGVRQFKAAAQRSEQQWTDSQLHELVSWLRVDTGDFANLHRKFADRLRPWFDKHNAALDASPNQHHYGCPGNPGNHVTNMETQPNPKCMEHGCQLSTSPQRSEQEWTVMKLLKLLNYDKHTSSKQLTFNCAVDAINAALDAAWKEHDDVVSALAGFSDTIKQLGARNQQLNAALAAERERADYLDNILTGSNELNASLQQELAAERQLADIGRSWNQDNSLEKWFPLAAKELSDLRQQLLSALAAIEKHNKGLSHANKRAYEIKIDRSALYARDAKVREPLVDLLNEMRNAINHEHYPDIVERLDALVKKLT